MSINVSLKSPKVSENKLDFNFLSIKGQEVMNKIGPNSNLPMSRNQVKYPMSPQGIHPRRPISDFKKKMKIRTRSHSPVIDAKTTSPQENKN